MLPLEVAANKPGCLCALGQIFSPKRWQEQRERDECSQMDTAVKLFLHNLMPFRDQIGQLESGKGMDLKTIGENTPFSARVYAIKRASGFTVTLDQRIIISFFLQETTGHPGFYLNPGVPATSFEHTMVNIDVVDDTISRVQKEEKSSLGNGEGNPGWIKERLIEVTKPVTNRKAITNILNHVANILTPAPDQPANP